MSNNYMMDPEVNRNFMEHAGHGGGGGELGSLWFIGWLFTIGYLRLSFWKGVLALIIWPYYLGKKYHKA